ncbi:MAG: hypothetical protein JWR10_4014 [Rubritepida sp.]|nr:hypothetical protein [Rubritepida sp.]
MTFTVLGFCEETGRLGAGIATYSLGVGAKCPQVRSNLGSVSSQAFSNPRLARLSLSFLALGHNAESALAATLATDEFASYRQTGIVDRNGRSAAYTGPHSRLWHGHRTGPGFSIFGNVLAGEKVVDAMAETFLATKGEALAERLMLVLEAGRDAGGQVGANGHLPERSSSLLIHYRDEHPELDLRVDSHPHAVEEMRRVYEEYSQYLPLYRMRAEHPPSAPPQEKFVAELEAKRALKA